MITLYKIFNLRPTQKKNKEYLNRKPQPKNSYIFLLFFWMGGGEGFKVTNFSVCIIKYYGTIWKMYIKIFFIKRKNIHHKMFLYILVQKSFLFLFLYIVLFLIQLYYYSANLGGGRGSQKFRLQAYIKRELVYG